MSVICKTKWLNIKRDNSKSNDVLHPFIRFWAPERNEKRVRQEHSFTICEFSVFAKSDKWCSDTTERSDNTNTQIRSKFTSGCLFWRIGGWWLMCRKLRSTLMDECANTASESKPFPAGWMLFLCSHQWILCKETCCRRELICHMDFGNNYQPTKHTTHVYD